MRTGHPLHLVQGDHAGDRLRAACRDFGLPGLVQVIGEDLSHGPLDDGRRRIGYMRHCYRGFETWTVRRRDAFAPWRQVLRRVARRRGPVLVWTSESVSDQVFLAMACHWFRSIDVDLFAVSVPPAAGRHGVGAATPEALAEESVCAERLSDAERADRAATCAALSAPGVLLRRWEAGTVRAIPSDSYDACVSEALERDWQPAADVVGAAMRRCDGHNRMSDLFFTSRLQVMIAAGVVEVEGERERLAVYRVRRCWQAGDDHPAAAGP